MYKYINSRFKNKECSIQVTIAEHLIIIINDLIQFFNRISCYFKFHHIAQQIVTSYIYYPKAGNSFLKFQYTH